MRKRHDNRENEVEMMMRVGRRQTTFISLPIRRFFSVLQSFPSYVITKYASLCFRKLLGLFVSFIFPISDRSYRTLGLSLVEYLNFHINCYNFMIFLLCLLHHINIENAKFEFYWQLKLTDMPSGGVK